MLQRIHDSVGRWIAGIILGLLAVAFVFWGVDFSMGGTTFAAKVNGEKISLAEFERELRLRENEFRQTNRIEIDDELARAMRRSVIDELVRIKALQQRVEEKGYRVSDERLLGFIYSVPAFQAGGQFSRIVFNNWLANQGMSASMFEQQQRALLALGDFETGIADTSFLTPAELSRYISLLRQSREIGFATFAVDNFLDRVEADDAEVEAHYEANSADYQTTETVDLEYIELSLADVAETIDVSEAELRAYYDQNRSRFETVEERFARHILFQVDEDTTDEAALAAAQSARERIEGGADFAEVAREVSEDVPTRLVGGELGWITPGMLSGPFEEALYSLDVNAVSEPVRTDFGYHLIKLEQVRSSEVQSFEEIRESLLAELQTTLAEDTFYDLVNDLDDKAFNAEDELATVAMEMGLELKTAEAFPRTGDRNVFPNSEAVVQAAFDEEVLLTGKNSEMVDLADDHVMVLRVAEYHPPTTKPLDEVREQIREALKREKARVLAEEAAKAFEAAFAALPDDGDPAALAAEHNGTWSAPRWVERTDALVPTEVLSQAFAMPRPRAGAPLRATAALAGGDYVVFQLSGVVSGTVESIDEEERKRMRDIIALSAADSELFAYSIETVADASVRVPNDILEPRY